MTDVIYKGVRRELAPGETVLECLRRHGVAVSSSCMAGACQTCMLRVVDGVLPTSAQRGLSEPLRRSDHFLACCFVPASDVEVAPPGAQLSESTAYVVEKTFLAPDIVRLRLWCSNPFDFRGGQFVQLVRRDGLVRSFSLASLADDGWLELHVRRIRGGRMSEWIHDELARGDAVVVRGPAGECFYAPEHKEQPMILAGTGTGAAPLWAIVRDALMQGHTGPLFFFHAVRKSVDLYLDAALQTLADRHPNLTYRGLVNAVLDEAVLETVPNPTGFKIALCGAPEIVKRLTTRLYCAGASLEDIAADPFIATPQGG